jgi:hypothetical protein
MRTEADAMDVADARIVDGPMGGGDAAALVAQGATLMRIENESMLSVAIQRPRDPKKVLSAAVAELEIVPEEAEAAYYSIPYKERQPDGSNKIVAVEGPSIDAAMTLSRLWGNCSVTARALEEDAVGATIAGIFIDFETNYRVERPIRITRVKKKRNGGTWTLDPQKWLAEYQAGVSKAQRNATVKGLPAWLVARYMKAAKAIAAGDPSTKADPKKVAGLLRGFERFKVTKEMLEKYVDAPVAEWMGTHLATLIGLGNAIKDKQLTVEEAFELEQPPAAAEASSAPATTTSGITVESVAGGVATAQDGGPSGPPAAAGASDVDTVKKFVETNAPPTAACGHPSVNVPAGGTVVCEDCTLEVTGPWPPPEETSGKRAKQRKLGE